MKNIKSLFPKKKAIRSLGINRDLIEKVRRIHPDYSMTIKQLIHYMNIRNNDRSKFYVAKAYSHSRGNTRA